MALRNRLRGKMVKLDKNTIVDVAIAEAVVRLGPDLINSFLPIPETAQPFLGVGAGFLLGSLLKKPLIANAAIAIGVVNFMEAPLADMIAGVTGGTSGEITTGTKVNAATPVSDFIRLSGYTNSPSVVQPWSAYDKFYN